MSRAEAAKSPGGKTVVAVIGGVVHVVIPQMSGVSLKVLGLKKQNPRSGGRPGGEFSGRRPVYMGAVWVSGAPVAKPIPKIKAAGWSANVVHARSRNRALGAGGKKLCKGVEHDVSPINAPSLLEPDARQQSENAIEGTRRPLSVEPSASYDTLCRFQRFEVESRRGWHQGRARREGCGCANKVSFATGDAR